jgi:hypothetical protein
LLPESHHISGEHHRKFQEKEINRRWRQNTNKGFALGLRIMERRWNGESGISPNVSGETENNSTAKKETTKTRFRNIN